MSSPAFSIFWFLYLSDQLSFQVKMSHPCHLCCLGLLCANSLWDVGALCPLTGASNQSPRILPLSLIHFAPVSNYWTFDRATFRKISLSLGCICVYPYIYQQGTDTLNTYVTPRQCKRCSVFWLPYLTIMLLKSQVLEQ